MRHAGPWQFIALGAALALATITGCATYKPEPIDAAANEAAFRQRRLADVFNAAHETPPETWDLPALTRVAVFYHPDIVIARAKLRETDAALVTAGQRPNPTFAWAPQYAFNPDPGQSPWVMGFDFDIPIEIAGKRERRIEQATALQESARLDLGDTLWKTRQRLRAALIDFLVTARQFHALDAQQHARAALMEMLQRRLDAGEISTTDLRLTRIDFGKGRVDREVAAAQLDAARHALADALGVSVDAVREAHLDPSALDRLADPGAADEPTIRRTGILNRLDIRRALADYDATEAALHLEVAKQYPDIHLGPGYQYDQGQNKLNFGFTTEVPIFHQNKGPIGEAAARREEAAAKVMSVQAAAIGAMEKSLAGYRAALGELTAADRFVADETKKLDAARTAMNIGEADRVSVAQEEVIMHEAIRARLESVRHVQAALTALEDAVQRPLDGTAELPVVARPQPEPPIAQSRD